MIKSLGEYLENFVDEDIKKLSKEELKTLKRKIKNKNNRPIYVTIVIFLMILTLGFILITADVNISHIFNIVLLVALGVSLISIFIELKFKKPFDEVFKNYFANKYIESNLFIEKLAGFQNREQDWLKNNNFQIKQEIELKCTNNKNNIKVLFDNDNRFVLKFNGIKYSDIYYLNDIVECQLIECQKAYKEEKISRAATAWNVFAGITIIPIIVLGGATGDEAASFLIEPKKKDVDYCENMFIYLKVKANNSIKELIILFGDRMVEYSSQAYKNYRKNAIDVAEIFEKYVNDNLFTKAGGHKIIYCKYCGTKNNFEDRNCCNCGGVLK